MLKINDLENQILSHKTRKIKVDCTGSSTLQLEEFEPFQGDLKTIKKIELLKLSLLILRMGFISPFCMWNKKILNGHQRLKALEYLKSKNFEIPPLPIVEIKAKSEADAKAKVLALDSAYAKINRDALEVFSLEIDSDIQELLSLPGIPDVEDEIDSLPGGAGNSGDIKESFEIIIEFDNEAELVKAYKKLQSDGFKCRV